MLFPVQLVTQNMKDENGVHYIRPLGAPAEQVDLLPNKPLRPKLQKRSSSSASMRSWSSKSSVGRFMTDVWDAMPVYNTTMHDPVLFTRRDGGSLSSRSSPRSSRVQSAATVPTLENLAEFA